MKRTSLLFCFALGMLSISATQVFGTDIYRLLDPVNGGRYGKSPSAGPPFLRFGNAQQYYHIVNSKYNGYPSAVSGSFSSWNNAGSVQFSSSSWSGLPLDIYYDNYGKNQYPYIVNPGQTYTAHDNYIINATNSYVQLNIYHNWGTVQDLQNDYFDVETILVHELGHAEGLAHPLTNSFTHDATAPIMAGGDNEYFWNHTATGLRTDDVNGTRFLQYNVWVPSQYSTIQDGLASSFSGSIVHVATGTYNVTSSLQVNTGITLTFEGASSVNFASDNSLTVNGTLNAVGSGSSYPLNMVTFDRSGTSNWGGIIFNAGSSGSLTWCYIKHGSPGVKCNGVLPPITNCTFDVNTMSLWLNNVGTPSTHISGNNFYGQSQSGQGVACYSSAPYIDGSAYFNNNAMGVFCVNSSPRISNTFFTNNVYALYLLASSSPTVGGLNRFAGNGTGVYVESPCFINSQTSDFYQFGGITVRANNSAMFAGGNNYWGQYPPNPADFVATNGATIYWQPGAGSPWTGPLPKMSVPTNTTNNVSQGNGPSDFSLDQRFFDAAKLLADGEYEKANNIYTQELKSTDNNTKKKYILMQLAECYKEAGRKDFTDFLNTQVRQNLSNDDDLYATTLELENLFLIPDHNYQKAIDNLTTLKTRFAKDGITVKNSLFNLGYIHTELLNDAPKGKEYYDELKAKFPNDMLTWEAKLMLREIDSIPSSAFLWKEAVTKSEPPTAVGLLGNYPNPFNPSTTINYQLPDEGIVTLKVFDVLGREVTTLVNERKVAGNYAASFDGSKFSSGLYFVHLSVQSTDASPYVKTMKILLVK